MEEQKLADEWNSFFKTDDARPELKLDFYSRNAGTYDKAMDTHKYRGTRLMAQLVHSYFSERPDAELIFIPAGTGNEIAELQRIGCNRYTNITALDGAAGMLDVLRKKNICNKYINCYFHLNSGVTRDTYDAVVCVGGFVPKHLQVDAIEEMCHILKPGGVVMVMLREAYLYESTDYNENKFFDAIDRVIESGLAEKVCMEQIPNYYSEQTGYKVILRKCYKTSQTTLTQRQL